MTANAGLVEPVGGFADLSDPGYAVSASIYWRTGRHDSFGLRLERSQFGGDPALESALSGQSGGAVDKLRFQLWTLNLTSRYWVAPDHVIEPFLQIALGAQGLRTSLKGPTVEGSDTVLGWSEDTGVGVSVRLGKALSSEVSAAYALGSGKGHATAGMAQVSTRGTIQYLQFKAGLVRRFGS